MGKKTKKFVSQHIDFEEQNDDLQDEVDLFHASNRKIGANAYTRKNVKKVEEVMDVEGEVSEESQMSESDFDDDYNDIVVLPGNIHLIQTTSRWGNRRKTKCLWEILCLSRNGVVGNEWGRKRKDFYGTEYVDEDWGGMRDEEVEDAELEEEDATGRQAALDKAAALTADLLEQQESADAPQTMVKETAVEWKFATVKKLNKRTSEILEEYNRRVSIFRDCIFPLQLFLYFVDNVSIIKELFQKDLMKVVVEPLVPVIEALPRASNIRKQLLLVFDVYSKYLLNLMFYLRLKADSFSRKNPLDDVIDVHPVMARIDRFSKMIRKVDAFLDKNASSLKKLLKKASQGQLLESIVLERSAKPEAQGEVIQSKKLDSVGEAGGALDYATPEERRRAAKQIEKNSAPDSKGRKKKEARIAKTKNRKRYKEAVKKVHSQVGTLRKELEKYTGESRGIRASTECDVLLLYFESFFSVISQYNILTPDCFHYRKFEVVTAV
ncbi:Sas10 protein [Teladorsagia circumcincta]|uniref:Sas10 protein n=1 Tax=Teladorsagia circumcincta TaxID=45464 RepID=A0A2G9V1X2_TELCI|nr:Sas10 protein [Teladorsagia circumcincta]